MEEDMKKTAVALSYDEEKDSAPIILASGRGYLAKKILEKAADENIPIHKDSSLAETLSKLEIGDQIPEELYKVVAEILVFLDRTEGKKKFVK